MLHLTRKMEAGEHITIVCLGDSNTEITFHTQGRQNWTGLLAEAIFETYGNGILTMINSGKCADTFTGANERLERDVIRFKPELVIIALGINDAGKGEKGLTEFKKQVRLCINKIQKECECEIILRTPNPVVTVNGLPLPPEQTKPGRAWEPETRPVKLYAQALVEVAQELGCQVVDHYTLWTEQKFIPKHKVANANGLWPRMSDAIHPGAFGHLCFFRELAPLFKVAEKFPWE